MNIAPTDVLDHLWQSTAFAGVAGLLTLALRTNRARVRQWLWFAASVKFLVPLFVLIALGSRIDWKTAPVRSNVPASTSFQAAPRSANPRSSISTSSVGVKQSCTSAMASDARGSVIPACR